MYELLVIGADEERLEDARLRLLLVPPVGFAEVPGVDSEPRKLVAVQHSYRLEGRRCGLESQRHIESHIAQKLVDLRIAHPRSRLGSSRRKRASFRIHTD